MHVPLDNLCTVMMTNELTCLLLQSGVYIQTGDVDSSTALVLGRGLTHSKLAASSGDCGRI